VNERRNPKVGKEKRMKEEMQRKVKKKRMKEGIQM